MDIVLHPVSHLATDKAVYAAVLGVPPQTDESYYVGFEAAGQHMTERSEVQVARQAGTAERGGGMTSPVATVTDPDGNVLGLLQDR
jgi:hypothetical protein